MSPPVHTNRLAQANSPYLLQHAHNPVDWYEWGDEALERARREDRPILLSVGYSACHWCHVMEHESFEDRPTADLMNRHFVCIKVDREERPDIDSIYMTAVQAMTGAGGWPMTVFLTPECEPFFAGTYFPPDDRHGLPSFPRVLEAMADAWQNRRADLLRQSAQLARGLRAAAQQPGSREPLTESILTAARSALARQYDHEWGGFGSAPKFPQPAVLEFMLRMHLRGHEDALGMVTRTLDRMAAGGVRDQLGGGFHRYSTDRMWLVPHFERMLYDNAQLLRLYVHAHQLTGEARHRRVAEEIAAYLVRELQHPLGGFFAAQDADSGGGEGRFFTWHHGELVTVAGAHGDAVADYYGALPEGNWEGVNVLWTPRPMEEVAQAHGMTADQMREAVSAARARLLDYRERRPKPATDDKILTGWNALAIAALAEAGAALHDSALITAGERAARFILDAVRTSDGETAHSWRAGRAEIPALLEDQAAMGLAALTLHAATLDPQWLAEALAAGDRVIALFGDDANGGFFAASAAHASPLLRPKELQDGAVPSGNSLAADLLLRLGRLTGEGRQEQAGAGALRLVRDLMERAPAAAGHALCALDFYLSPPSEIALIGDPRSDDTRELARIVRTRFLPRTVFAAAPAPTEATRVALLQGRDLRDGRAAAYVCEGFACQAPVSEPGALAELLG